MGYIKLDNGLYQTYNINFLEIINQNHFQTFRKISLDGFNEL